MIIIGEKLNSSIKSTLTAFESEDSCGIISLIKSQEKSGAQYLDINTAMLGDNEQDKMIETIKLIIYHSSLGIMIDTIDMEIARVALDYCEGRKVIINSVSLSTDITPLIDTNISDVGIVLMPTSEDGIPETPQSRLQNILTLYNKIKKLNIKDENIYADILTESAAVNQNAATHALETLLLIKDNLPNIKTICGTSNISYGLPKRRFINCAFIAMAISSGIDSMIIDIANPEIKGTVLATEVLMGRDEYCMNYIDIMR